MLKFNMGCGHRKLPGYVNVDAFPECKPDEVWDLERTPWPWPDNCAEQVLFIHSLEHMGASSAVFLAIMKELHRICAPGAEVVIVAPHPRHDDFLNDPTHVRPITLTMLGLFDRQNNDNWKAEGSSNTPLAHYLGVDFRRKRWVYTLDPRYQALLDAKEVTEEDLGRLVQERLNVVKQLEVSLVVQKP